MRFHHVGMVVPDLEAAIQFYQRALDFSLLFRGEWTASSAIFDGITGLNGSAAKTAFLDGPCGYLELFEYASPESAGDPAGRSASDFGLRHICIETDAPGDVLERILTAGGQPEGQLTSVPGGAEAVYCRDPFGNILELLKPGGRIPPRG